MQKTPFKQSGYNIGDPIPPYAGYKSPTGLFDKFSSFSPDLYVTNNMNTGTLGGDSPLQQTTGGTTTPTYNPGGLGAKMVKEGFNPLSMVSGVFGIAGGIFAGIKARKDKRRAERQMKAAEQKMKEQENIYKNLDTSNPYLNMENTMEDLTINQKQADFEKQSFQQSQANIMEGLRSAAGSSGIASLAQSLAQQGQLASQKASASIGQQEQRNQMAAARMAGTIQAKEREGDVWSRRKEEEKALKLRGWENQRYNQQQQLMLRAEQAQAQATQDIIGGVGNLAMGGLGIG